MTAAVFTLAYLAIAVFGLPAAFHPVFRGRSLIARWAASFLLGSVALTLAGLVWSLLGIGWTWWSLGLPLGALSVGAAIALARRPKEPVSVSENESPPDPMRIAATAVTLAALVFLAWQFATTRATSSDFLFFWGVKGLHFAREGGIDAELLRWPFFAHAHTNYPPLLPTTFAWGVLVAGAMPWIWAPVTAWIWVAAAAAVLGPILRPRLGATPAAVLTCLWTVVLSASIATSQSGGNAEAPLVAFLTVACAVLIVRSARPEDAGWALVAVACAGAVLTKNEGPVSVALLGGGALLRAMINRDRREILRVLTVGAAAAGAVGVWALFLKTNDLPLIDPIREKAGAITFDYLREILAALPAGLDVGTATWSWWLLALAAAVSGRRIVGFLPAVALCLGLLAFTFVYYLHSANDPTILIGWTLARLCQPALSALVLWAGLAWLHGNRQPV